MALLRQGSIDEADVRFGAALKVNPHLVKSLSREQQQSLILELEGYRKGGLNAANLLLQLWAARKALLPVAGERGITQRTTALR